MAERFWTLFIDESGDFETEPSVATGFLVEASDSASLDTTLRDVLAAAVPYDMWPLHTAHLNVAAFSAVAWAERGPRTSGPDVPPSTAKVLTSAAERLRVLAPEAWAAAVTALHRGDDRGPGGIDPFRRLDRALREADLPEDRDLFRALACERETARNNIARSMTAFAQASGVTSLVVAGHVRQPDVQAGADSYLESLVVLFERVFALLRGPDRHVVRVHAATRRVGRPGAHRELTAVDVDDAIGRAESFPLGAPQIWEPDPHVIFQPMKPPRYDCRVPSGVVWADFVANLLRWNCGNDAPWGELSEAVRLGCGLAHRFPAGLLPEAGPLPTLARAGTVRTMLSAVCESPSGPEPMLPRGSWFGEQAISWASAVRTTFGGSR